MVFQIFLLQNHTVSDCRDVSAGLRAQWLQDADAAPQPSAPSREEQELAELAGSIERQVVDIMKRAGVQFVTSAQ